MLICLKKSTKEYYDTILREKKKRKKKGEEKGEKRRE